MDREIFDRIWNEAAAVLRSQNACRADRLVAVSALEVVASEDGAPADEGYPAGYESLLKSYFKALSASEK